MTRGSNVRNHHRQWGLCLLFKAEHVFLDPVFSVLYVTVHKETIINSSHTLAFQGRHYFCILYREVQHNPKIHSRQFFIFNILAADLDAKINRSCSFFVFSVTQISNMQCSNHSLGRLQFHHFSTNLMQLKGSKWSKPMVGNIKPPV